DKSIDNVQVRGVSPEYVNFSSFDAERGRLMSPTEVESARPVAVVGWQTADRLFGSDVDPIEKVIQIEGVHFRVVGVSSTRGARRADIMAQMLTESVVLSMFGGVIGTLLGTAIATVISQFTPVPASIEPWSVALGIGITALVGLFFGLYPAMRAARLDPIEAVRRE